MADIKEIFSQYPEEILQNSISGKLINNVKWKKQPILIQLESMESNQILFSLNKQPHRIVFTSDLKTHMNIENDNPTYFRKLYWISELESDEKVKIKFLNCGNGQKFNTSLDIGFGDNIIMLYKNVKIEELEKRFKNDFVFRSENYDFIFIQTYPSNSDKSYSIYGSKKRADIVVSDNKWIITKIVNRPFPKKHTDFLQLSIAQYEEINFIESSKAKEAYETIKEEAKKGNTLINLWQAYSSIELERANQLKEKFGDLKFSRIKFLSNSLTRARISGITEEVKILINESKEDILNTSLEIIPEKEIELKNDKAKKFKINTINNDFTFDLYDELNLLPESGVFSISLLGDEIVTKRRERALRSLREDQRFITRNLLFAIEGVADAMIDKKRKEKALTDRTRKFLKQKFGIDELTPNQKEAVEIAINTPDIAIIQGPPGTGKTTVVAAICDRLIEIGEKLNMNLHAKLILVSAFQNDTVEHIASKIYTLGLPTIKIGKETQNNIRAEDKLIGEMRLSIDNFLHVLSSKGVSHRISKKLNEIKTIFLAENNEIKTRQNIDLLLGSIEISDALWNEWKDINANTKYNEMYLQNSLSALKGLRTEFESYNDDGLYKIQKLLNSDIQLTQEEKSFFESSPVDNPTNKFLDGIRKFKEKYLEEINYNSNSISSGNNLSILSWIDDAIAYFIAKEEVSYEDENTFTVANLEALRDDLDGNTDYIRDTIKNYGESLAATNQVAGGREMSSYESIENVILEEAARSNPLDLLIPMSKATERIIMVGDQNQLPHLLEDDIADETSFRLSDKFIAEETRLRLEESLFGVIFKNLKTAKPIRTISLTEQFRMHPFIGDFISRVYYEGNLKPGFTNQSELKKHNLQLSWAKNKVAIYCDVGRSAGQEQRGKSKSRSSEAIRIIKLLDELKTDPNFENLSVGIITFYAKQVDEIFREAAKKGYADIKPNGEFEISKQYRETGDLREKLRIGSVDSFQGKEFDIVILSTVRSNDFTRSHENYKKVFGFLTLENRLNVAFSRSQKLLIVVGNSEMFADDFAKTYVEGLYEFYNNLTDNKIYGNRIQ